MTLLDLCDYIIRYASSIPVRVMINGRPGDYFLSELPAEEAIKQALTFVKNGEIPHRVLKSGEFNQEEFGDL